MRQAWLLPLLLLAGCGSDPAGDVPPLPKQDEETARDLMNEAERAAVAVRLELQGTGHTDELVAELDEREGVLAVDVERPGDE